MEANFKAALFDLDGVIFNTEPQYTNFWHEQFKEFHPGRHELEKDIKGQTLIQIYDKFFNGQLTDKRSIITNRLNNFEKQMKFDYITGFEDFILDLHRNDVYTAVVTSSNNAKMKAVYLAHPEFISLFNEILTAEDFEHSKPAPDCYLKAAQRFKCSHTECIVFEDSFNGLKSGKAAQMKVVGLATTNAVTAIAPFSDLVIDDFHMINYSKCVELLKQCSFRKLHE